MRHFLIKILQFATPLVILVPLWILLVKTSEWSNFGYLKFQVDKLADNKGRHFNVVYIGDSSGGNALSTENDSTSINLCLTGAFGYNGLVSYIDIIDQYISYDTIVVVNTIDMPTRQVNDGVYWIPYLHSDNFMEKSIAYFYSIQYAKGIILSRLVNYYPVPKSEFTDFPIIKGKTEATSNSFENKIDAQQLENLKALNDKLKSSTKKFYLLFGPTLPYDKGYFKELCEVIAKYQIQHTLNPPYLLSNNSKGDSPDHVHPSYRDSTTSYYKYIILNSSLIRPSQ